MGLIGQTISKLRELLVGKKVSAREILDAHITHIEKLESNICAFNTLTVDLASKQAQAIDNLIANKASLPPLAGIPIAIKDNICLPGYPTTCSSKILSNFFAPYAATVTTRLFEAGALCLGKTNMDEFAMGASTENSAFKLTRNPWDLSKVPGGSSGGSAAAVASGDVVAALGSDTGGSIRQPASFCGVVGMKPTYGLVSRFGLVAFASSLDQLGPIGRSVEDVACMLEVIAGHDAKDSTSLNEPLPQFTRELSGVIKGLRIGVIQELMGQGIDADVSTCVRTASEVFRELGANVAEVSMPYSKHALPVYYIIATAEASANLARYDGVKYGYRSVNCEDVLSLYYTTRKEGFGPEVKRRIMLGTYALSSGYYDAYYRKAQQVRRLVKEDFDRAFQAFDVLICPTSPSVAFEFGAKTAEPLQMYLSDIATVPANLAGIPGISIVCGFDSCGLPIGLQLLAPALQDLLLLKAAYAFEQATEFHKQKPPITAAIECPS
ncbi:MAG: Asp-tRNA(Asn)/Glu-tRNA(Gln) amidotransferase subunit GatA [Candidatus Melainabacteria bacterium]|nr:Asp-tRNA(Asn)/Glu-tRNA(Gln) amidotransferase subunit GatA [Candidatus Melainabacteria bacterium]